MSQPQKAAAYAALKEAGYRFEKHYRNYTTDELMETIQKFEEMGLPIQRPATVDEAAFEESAAQPSSELASIPLKERDVNELPGERLNSKSLDEPIRVDEKGVIWYQEEVRKPGSPMPRGRRVMRISDPGVRKQRVEVGEYTEEFEVAGNRTNRTTEIKITLPSYQVGIYKDPRFPFKIYEYNNNRGFSREDVERYYGGKDLVPATVKKKYVDTVLAYDIPSVVRTIQEEARALQLQGRIQ